MVGGLALARLAYDRVGPDAICRQQHDAGSPHMLLAAVPIRDDRLQTRAIGAAPFNRDPLAHARPPTLSEHTLIRDSYVKFTPLGNPDQRDAMGQTALEPASSTLFFWDGIAVGLLEQMSNPHHDSTQ